MLDRQETNRLRGMVATLVLEDPIYTPILERLESIIADEAREADVASRARKIVERRRDMEMVI
jgi:hypothetical protein